MELNSNYINKYIHENKTQPVQETKTQQVASNGIQQNNLPSTHAAGLSQVTTNTPVSYTKIADIQIPNLNEKASVFKLSNGQKVAILPKKGPTYVRTSYSVGSLNEPDEMRGISHYIEHNLFNGSKDLAPKEYDKRLTLLGGNTNAFTSYNVTEYFLGLQLLEDKSLEEAIRLNALQTQYPTFPNDQLEKEKEPVKSEIDMVKDDPLSKALTTMVCNLYNLKTTSEDIVIGTKDNINNLTREKVLDYYNTWYTPDNAVTVITGDVDVNETIELVSKHFNKKADTSKHNQRIYPNLVPANKPIRVDQTQNVHPLAFITMGFPVDGNITPAEKEQLNVLFSLMRSENSPISKKLDKYGLSLDLFLEELSSDKKAPKMITTILAMPDEYVEDVLKIIYEGITYYANNPPSQKDLQNQINAKINGLENVAEYSSDISSTLVQVLKENDYNYFTNTKNTLQTMTPMDIQNVARKFLDLNKVSMCIAHPNTTTPEQMIESHKTAQNSPKISFGRKIDINQDVINEFNQASNLRLQNAMEVAILPSGSGTNANLSIELKSDINENIYKCTTDVLSEMINRGSYYKQNSDYKNTLEENNIGLGFSVGPNSIHVSSSFRPEKSDMAMALIKETLMSPNFTEEEFQRAKKLVKDSLLNSTKSPFDKLNQHSNPNSKYYANKEEQLQVLENLTLNDIRQLYSYILYNSQALTTCALNKEDMLVVQNSLINNLSVGLPQFRQFIPAKDNHIQKYQPNTQPYLYTATEDQAQAEIVQSYQFKRTGNIDDTAKITLLDMILGSGGMSSRLFIDLRETQKLAYHVGSEYTSDYDRGEIILDIDTSTESDGASPENINKALEGFDKNIQKLKTEYVPQEELDSMKAKLKADILNGLESNSSREIMINMCKDSPYGMEHYSKLLEAIDKVTVEDIKTTANYVFANPPITSIVASPKTLETLGI